MTELGLLLPSERPPRLIFIGAHCDDIEIGCGGTVLELLRRHPGAEVCWVVLSSEGPRKAEARRASKAMLRGAGACDVRILDFRGAYFPSQMAELKDAFEDIKRSHNPDVIFTHHRDDLHQDHRVVGELTWNTFRNHLILEYEIPKYDGGLGSPSFFVPIRPAFVKRKVDLLMRIFTTQHQRVWFTPDTFTSIMRLRGIECNAAGGHAEAFHARKIVLGGAR